MRLYAHGDELFGASPGDLLLNSFLAVSKRGLHYFFFYETGGVAPYWTLLLIKTFKVYIWLTPFMRPKGSSEVPLFYWKFETLVIVMWRYKAF
jgi:hypothetical protein